METAQALGDEASAKGVEALAALPHTAAIDAKDIDDLKRMGKHRLADSLANVKRMLDSSDFTLNMMSGMASFANMGDWAEGNTDGTNVVTTTAEYEKLSQKEKYKADLFVQDTILKPAQLAIGQPETGRNARHVYLINENSVYKGKNNSFFRKKNTFPPTCPQDTNL